MQNPLTYLSAVGPDGRTYYGDQPTDNTAKRVERANAIGPVPLSEVEIEESTFKYFPISGSTPRELHESMLANGPFNQIAQRRVIGECGWNIKSTVEYERKAGQCGIGKFKVTLMTGNYHAEMDERRHRVSGCPTLMDPSRIGHSQAREHPQDDPHRSGKCARAGACAPCPRMITVAPWMSPLSSSE